METGAGGYFENHDSSIGIQGPNARVLALVRNETRDGQNDGRISYAPASSERAGVSQGIEANGIRSKIERRHARRSHYSNLVHHVGRELRHPP